MFEVIVNPTSKTVETQQEVDDLIAEVQHLFGEKVAIQVNEVSKTYDAKTAEAKEVGTISKRVAEYPAKADAGDVIDPIIP